MICLETALLLFTKSVTFKRKRCYLDWSQRKKMSRNYAFNKIAINAIQAPYVRCVAGAAKAQTMQ